MTTVEPEEPRNVVFCSDGDCIYQFDELCHCPRLQVDDSHCCTSRQTENERGEGNG